VPPDPLLDPLLVFTIDVLLSRCHDRRLRENHDVEVWGARPPESPKSLTKPSLHGVPRHGTADPSAHRQAQAIAAESILDGDEGEEPPIEAPTAPQRSPKVRPRDHAILAPQGRSR
jgi:hypothetical protein